MRIFILLILSAFASYGQNAKYEAAILKGKKMVHPDSYTNAYNYFERIAQKEPDQWLPWYYQAQILAIQSAGETDLTRKESQLNVALDLIGKAGKLEKNAEVVALEGFVQMLRLTVDPAVRGQTLSPTIFGLFNQALAMDPGNPRALLFLGQMQYGTARFFGSGFEEACQYIQQAYDIFDEQPEEETIFPTWGKRTAEAAIRNCTQ